MKTQCFTLSSRVPQRRVATLGVLTLSVVALLRGEPASSVTSEISGLPAALPAGAPPVPPVPVLQDKAPTSVVAAKTGETDASVVEVAIPADGKPCPPGFQPRFVGSGPCEGLFFKWDKAKGGWISSGKLLDSAQEKAKGWLESIVTALSGAGRVPVDTKATVVGEDGQVVLVPSQAAVAKAIVDDAAPKALPALKSSPKVTEVPKGFEKSFVGNGIVEGLGFAWDEASGTWISGSKWTPSDKVKELPAIEKVRDSLIKGGKIPDSSVVTVNPSGLWVISVPRSLLTSAPDAAQDAVKPRFVDLPTAKGSAGQSTAAALVARPVGDGGTTPSGSGAKKVNLPDNMHALSGKLSGIRLQAVRSESESGGAKLTTTAATEAKEVQSASTTAVKVPSVPKTPPMGFMEAFEGSGPLAGVQFSWDAQSMAWRSRAPADAAVQVVDTQKLAGIEKELREMGLIFEGAKLKADASGHFLLFPGSGLSSGSATGSAGGAGSAGGRMILKATRIPNS